MSTLRHGRAAVTARTTREDLLALFAVSRFGVCALASDGRFVFWNQSAERITGLAAAHVLGRRHDEIIVASGHRADESLCWNGLEGRYRGCAPRPVTVRLQCRSGLSEQIMLTPIIVADDPGDDALTLWLFDAPTNVEAHETDSPGGTEPRREPGPAAAPEASAPGSVGLTRREMEILRLIAAGTGTEQIASRLAISVHTVRNHVRSLRHKLDAKTKLDAVMTAMRHDLL